MQAKACGYQKTVSTDAIYTALKDDTAWIRVTGKGTFQNSHPIKKWILDRIGAGCRHIFIDLGECIGMDSTFMGVITGLSIKMKGFGMEPITLVNISPHNMRLLETLGLNRFLNLKEKYDIDSTLIWEPILMEPLDKLTITKHMLEAHERLIDTGGIVAEQFKNVYKLLKEDLERQSKKNNN